MAGRFGRDGALFQSSGSARHVSDGTDPGAAAGSGAPSGAATDPFDGAAILSPGPPFAGGRDEGGGKVHDLDPALIAAFILAEQRDQSRNEDARDYGAAVSIKQANTSIGIGQAVISTVRRHDLFADLLRTNPRRNLSQDQIAEMLVSEEFNIFAVARYIRIVANEGAKQSAARLQATNAKFPGINFLAYSRPSAEWPIDNVRVLGSEYTSSPWDDRLSPGRGDFVNDAYTDMKSSNLFQ